MNNIKDIASYLSKYDGPCLKLMEICGTHTSSIAKNGIRSIISPNLQLCSGPGCPVCVTPQGYIDRLCTFAKREKTVVLTFGDMMKVPGTRGSLAETKAQGGSVEVFYSPFEAVEKAKKRPDLTYIIGAVGFETTAPIYCLLVKRIVEEKITNIRLLTALKLVIPVLEVLCLEDEKIDGFIAPGHVSAIIGSQAFKPLAKKFKKPFAVSGFSAEEVLVGIYDLVKQLESNEASVHNLYKRVVKEEGNFKAVRLMDKYFETKDTFWRGIGLIPYSGLYLKEEYAFCDAGSRSIEENEAVISGCRCSEVIRGKINSIDCGMFARECTPSHPLGPCMVSGEGACGIWYKEGVGK